MPLSIALIITFMFDCINVRPADSAFEPDVFCVKPSVLIVEFAAPVKM